MARRPLTLKQRIELDGGEKIRRQFREFGSEGEKAFKQLQEAARKAEGPAARFARRIDGLRKDFDRLGDASAKFATRASGVGIVLGAIAGAAALAGGAFAKLADSATEAQDEIGKTAAKLGVSAAEFERLDAIAELSGTGARTLRTAFSRLNVAIVKTRQALEKTDKQAEKTGKFFDTAAARVGRFVQIITPGGTTRYIKVTEQNVAALNKQLGNTKKAAAEGAAGLDESAKAIRDLGVDVSEGRSNYEIFKDIIQALSEIEDPAERSGKALLIFGQRAGAELGPLIAGGRKEIERLEKLLARFGIGIDTAGPLSKISAQFQDSLTLLERALDQKRRQFGVALAQIFQQPLDDLLEYLAQNNARFTELANKYAADVADFYTDLANAFAFKLDEGGNLVFFNEDQVSEARKYLIEIRDAAIDVGTALKFAFDTAVGALDLFSYALYPVAELINQIFGTELTGRALALSLVILSITGVFSLLSAAIGVAFTVGTAFVGLLGLIGIKIPNLGKVWTKASGAIVKGFKALRARAGKLVTVVSGPLTNVFSKFSVTSLAKLGRVFGFLLRFLGWPGLFITALAIIYDEWDNIADFLKKSVQVLGASIAQLWDGSAAEAFFNTLVDLAGKAASSIGKFFSNLFGGSAQASEVAAGGVPEKEAGAYWEAFVLASRNAWKEVAAISLQQMRLITEQLKGISLAKITEQLVGPFRQAFAQLEEFFTKTLPDFVRDGMAEVVSILEGVVDKVEAAVDRIKAAAEAAKRAVQSIPSGGGGGSQTTDGFATGGHVRGPGSGTSDSIPAWLSDGEFVIRASAVRRYGVAFLQALNSMKLDPRVQQNIKQRFATGGQVRAPRSPRISTTNIVQQFTRSMPKFATGGLVQQVAAGMPKFALGGLVDAATVPVRLPTTLPQIVQPNLPGKSFDLTIGAETFRGLFAPEDAARQIEQFARRSAMKSAGARPTWQGGRR